MPEPRQRNDIESQTSPLKETSPQVSGSSTEPFVENQTGRTRVHSLNDSKKRQSEIQRHEMNMAANEYGDDNISTPKITISQIGELLARDDITNELYWSLSSTIVLIRKKEMLYVPLDSENSLTIDALVDLRAYASAIVQTELDRIKQQAPANFFKINDPPNFQIQVANCQLEETISTASLKFDIGDITFAQHLVVTKKLTGPNLGLHLMRHKSLVNDTTHGLIHFPHLTMLTKNAATETSAKP